MKNWKLFISVLLLLCACEKDELQDKDAYYRSISDHVQETCISDPNAIFQYIDSLEVNQCIPVEVADYFRANSHYALNNLRAVEYYNKKALNGDGLFNEWRRGYYVASRNLANNLNWKGDYENSIEFATKAYEKSLSDTSFVAKLNAPGLLLHIALCQKSLGNKTESYKNFELGYQQSLALTHNDTTFNTNFYYIQNTLAVIVRMGSETPKEMAELWIKRSEDAIARLYEVSRLHPIGVVDQNLMQTAMAQMYIGKARLLILQGQNEAADSAYDKFMHTEYATTINGMVSQYNYMRAAKRWDKAAALIPIVDSVRVIKGVHYSLDYLRFVNVQRQTLDSAGLHQKAQQKAELLMQKLDTVIDVQQQSTANELAVIFETAQKERKIAEQEVRIRHQWLLIVGIPWVFAIFFFIFYTLQRQKVIKNISTEHRKLQKAYNQLAIANERAEEASRMKSAFIRQISHEIRTPLNILSGFSQIVTDESYHLDENARRDANQRIIDNTIRITEVVNKMLELSEASSRTPISRDTETNVQTIVNYAITQSQIGSQPGIDFIEDIDENSAKVVLVTSEQRAVRTLCLLLDNAQKFTKNGNVWLRTRLSEDGKYVRLIVEDNGPGIPPTEAEHIFEEFVQLDEYIEGTGIGLSVARAFARQLGGDVVLDTNYTSGARFVMTLPLN